PPHLDLPPNFRHSRARKRGRVVEGSGFENRRRATYRGFESLRFRQPFAVANHIPSTARERRAQRKSSSAIRARCGYAFEFMQDIASRLGNRVQLTTDSHKPYLQAVHAAFGGQIDY